MVRIIICDDMEAIAVCIAEMVKELGYQPIVFTEPILALEAARACRADLIITDQNMPCMTGEKLLQEAAPIPGFIVTGMQNEFERLGSDRCMQKPFAVSELEAMINKHLPKSRDIPAAISASFVMHTIKNMQALKLTDEQIEEIKEALNINKQKQEVKA